MKLHNYNCNDCKTYKIAKNKKILQCYKNSKENNKCVNIAEYII